MRLASILVCNYVVHVYACEFAPVAEVDSVIHAAFELQSMGELILPLHFVCVSFVFLFCFFKRLRRKLTEAGLCVRGLLCGFKIFLKELLH